MKKIDKKVKSKQKPKTKTVMKQKQKQNQSVVINISQNKAKTRTSIPRTVKPSYLQSITTYPIFREETAHIPLYRNPEPKKEESVFVDKTTLRTEVPTVNNIDIPVIVKTPGHNVSKLISGANLPVKKTESQMIAEYDNLYENVVPKPLDFSVEKLVKPKYPRGMGPPLTQEEIKRKKDELNQKRRTEYAIKKREKSLQ
jgi:hypothetical protein